MKFMSLAMRNWRSFHGDHRVEFSIDPSKPVTLILGPNGAGKTALLNAFTWALYGEFTDGFARTGQLVNLDAVEMDPSAETWVELTLVHEEDEFRVRRVTDARRQSAGEYDLTVTKNGERAVEDDIYRILPKALKDLFFFPAETFSTASVLEGNRPGEGSSLNIGQAIRSLLAGDIYDRAIEDLRKAIESQSLKPPKNYSDHTVEEARRKYEQAQEELNTTERRRDDLPGLLADARDKASKAKKEAERYNPEEIAKWEHEYEQRTGRVRQAEDATQRAHGLYVNLARKAHLHFAQSAVQSAISQLDLAEKAGLMPPRIHESVLDKTLTDCRCTLCGGPLSEAANQRIKTLRAHVGDARVAVRGMETRSLLLRHAAQEKSEVANLRKDVASLAAELGAAGPQQDADMRMLQAVLRTCVDMADGLLTKATRELTEFTDARDVERPPEGESPVETAMVRQKSVDLLVAESQVIESEIEKLSAKARELLADYTRKSSKSEGHKRKTAAIEILREVKDFFDTARKGLNQFGREDFEKAINDTYSDLIAKPYQIHVGEDFGITVRFPGKAEEIPLSQSEKVLVLIAFLGAIARLAPIYEEIARRKQQLQRTGSVATSRSQGFPVVLDSPTSPLDDEYEADVVNALPKLLPQVVVLVSAKSVAVWEEIAGSVGSANIMELTSSVSSNRTVRWNGKDYTYSAQDVGVAHARTRMTSIS
ncbi:AAA family ATPase [Streptomyces sp. SLBN-134]|uniref:AAA family ATPase n=1 Tax=Streptomyces sp. SLBN-134 TaxID=2768456 RepID=UPI00114F29EA|nr:AAA family ATPase [Streptomyces sp. SLBN-134]TQL20171.1 DNA sulfur modification protein DndD [Streptomyces sp. SLBN-134]